MLTVLIPVQVKPGTPDTDAVLDGLPVAEHEVEPTLTGGDDNRAGALGARPSDQSSRSWGDWSAKQALEEPGRLSVEGGDSLRLGGSL